MKRSSQPFTKTIPLLMDEADVTLREISRRTMAASDWGRPSTLSLIFSGKMRATMEAMEHIAWALRVPPEVFAEYRLGVARRGLDPEQVELKRALKNLGE